MNQGSSGNRRQSRSRTRNRDAYARFPRGNPKHRVAAHIAKTSDAPSSSCQPCSDSGFGSKRESIPQRSSSVSSVADQPPQGEVVYGPWPRPRTRSQSSERCRNKNSAPMTAEKAWRPTLVLKTTKRTRRSWSDIPPCADTSESSSGPEPMSSPTLSRDSSTLSLGSASELFPFDSEIFAKSPEKSSAGTAGQVEEDLNDGVVALRNPNTVALCPPPKMITQMPSKLALGIPNLRGSFGTIVPPTPPLDVRDVMATLNSIAGNTQAPGAAAALNEMAMCPKDIAANPSPPHKPFKPLPSNQSQHHAPGPVHKPHLAARHRHRRLVQPPRPSSAPQPDEASLISKVGNATECSPLAVAARNLKFCCQLAHGSPTAIISNFASVDELFQSIADCFNISPDDIIFCTINTFKPDMDKLFAGSLEYSDMLFAHVKGQAVELEMTKTDALFGLTVSDNGRCRSFIKRIKDDSVAARARPALAIGQLIEKIDGVNVTGMRHYEVVRILRNMPIGKTFTIRVVSPKQSGFQQIAPRSLMSHKKSINDGLRTLRFKANGGVVIEQGVVDKVMIGRLNDILDSYLGVQDDQMAQALWDLALTCETLPEMNKAVRESELSVFDFPEELVFDMWGVIGDWRRMQSKAKEEKKTKKSGAHQQPIDDADDEEQFLLPLF